MQTSEQIDKIAEALAKAQAAIKNPKKAHVNPHFRNSYADMADGLDVIRPALSEQGIAITQPTSIDGDVLILHTRLIHAGSGQWIEGVYPVCKIVAQHQQIAAAMTYAKRNSLFGMVGVAGQGDDMDGEESADAASPPKRDVAPRPSFRPSTIVYSPMESRRICDEMLESLESIANRAELHDWATANSEAKGKLVASDQQRVHAAFKDKQAAIAHLKSAAE